MYEFEERIRYSETTENGLCSILALVNYLQDCSTFHSEDAGAGMEYLKERHRAWFLSSWDIYIDRMPRLCERIIVGTCPREIKGIMAHRNFWIRAAGKENTDYLVRADSQWFSMNLETGKPERVTMEMVEPYGEIRNVLQLPQSKRRIVLPEEMQCCEAVQIQPHHIDSNHHVNNAQYIAIAAEAALQSDAYRQKKQTTGTEERTDGTGQGQIPELKRIRAEYKQAAVLHDVIIPYAGMTEDGMVVSLKNKNGETYANVEFR